MNIFVVDANIFSISLKNLSLSVFEDDIYLPWSEGMKEGSIISVDEVYRELDALWGAENPKDKRQKEGNWLKDHKYAFQNPSNAECTLVAEIYKSKKFREGVKERSLREGTPEADAFLVAKAKCVGGILVTNESNSKPNSEKIPCICVKFDVPYINRDGFFQMLKNRSQGIPELNNVQVFRSLIEED